MTRAEVVAGRCTFSLSYPIKTLRAKGKIRKEDKGEEKVNRGSSFRNDERD